MAGDVRIEIKPFGELTLKQLHACLKLRGEVFVVGQRICAVPDVDEHDPAAHHVMMWLDGELIGTARLMLLDEGKTVKVGRVGVDQRYRGRGFGGSMMRAIQRWIEQEPGRKGKMSAQAHLERWYAGLGWIRNGTEYMEAGIPHLELYYPSENGG